LSQTISGLNSFLEELAQQGARESTGEFTLSLDSMRKLSKYQLIDPNLYVLNVFSMAVLGGASYFQVDHTTKETSFRFDGRTYTTDELQTLASGHTSALRELAIALTALRSLTPKEVSFLSDGGYSIQGEGTGEVFHQGNEVNELRVHRPRNGSSWLARFTAPDAPVWEEILLQSTCYTKLAVQLNGLEVPKKTVDVFLPALQFKGPESALPSCKPVGFEQGESVFQLSTPSGFSALLGGSPNRWAEQWNIVLMGVNYDRPISSVPLGGLGGIVVTDSLKKNLSQSDLVEDETFESMVSELQAGVIEMVLTQLTRFPLAKDRLGNWDQVAIWAGEQLRDRGDKDGAMQVETWALAHRNEHRKRHFNVKDELAGRYEDPVRFLEAYLGWFSGASPVDQIERFVFSLGLPVQKGSAVAAIVREKSDSLPSLYARLMPHFPNSVSWKDLSSIIENLEPEIAIAPLEAHLPSIKGITSWSERESICEAASFLHRHRRHDFSKWLERALGTGFLHYEDALIDWLKERDLFKLVEGQLAKHESKKEKNPLYDVSVRFTAFEKRVTYDLDAVRDSLPITSFESLGIPEQSRVAGVACALGLEARESNRKSARENRFALEDAVEACLLGMNPEVLRESAPQDKWEQHRLALVLRCAGRTEEADQWCRSAHRWLGDHWFNYLLMGDTHLLGGHQDKAHESYSKALDRSSDSVSVQEAVAQTSPLVVRAQLWEKGAAAAVGDANEGPIRVYLNFQEALMAAGGRQSFLQWVRLRVRTSFAHQALDQSEKGALSILSGSSLSPRTFVETAALHPSVARAAIRNLVRKNDMVQAMDLLSRYRLLEMLETPSLDWRKL
jgi:tetratricopeptide (TPR) repeat protein